MLKRWNPWCTYAMNMNPFLQHMCMIMGRGMALERYNCYEPALPSSQQMWIIVVEGLKSVRYICYESANLSSQHILMLSLKVWNKKHTYVMNVHMLWLMFLEEVKSVMDICEESAIPTLSIFGLFFKGDEICNVQILCIQISFLAAY